VKGRNCVRADAETGRNMKAFVGRKGKKNKTREGERRGFAEMRAGNRLEF